MHFRLDRRFCYCCRSEIFSCHLVHHSVPRPSVGVPDFHGGWFWLRGDWGGVDSESSARRDVQTAFHRRHGRKASQRAVRFVTPKITTIKRMDSAVMENERHAYK